jgi:hypothetical protein
MPAPSWAPTARVDENRDAAFSILARCEVHVTNPDAIRETLERARGLLANLVDQCEVDQLATTQSAALGGAQLRNMLVHVENMEARVADDAQDSDNTVKRLRDFSKTIERCRPAALDLVALLRQAADQLTAATQPPSTS